MCISNGYRWNVPVVTYGFDQSFLNFFGSNGVAAVQGAIQIFNDLPPASQMVLTNYPFNSQQFNGVAQARILFDLKSETLSLLLEHLGLADPARYIYVSRLNNPLFYPGSPYLWGPGVWPIGTIPEYVVQRNYDPQTLAPSVFVDNANYDNYTLVLIWSDWSFTITPYGVDQSGQVAVADFVWNVGEFFTGLTYDDVGGLSYLYSTNNVNYETLIPGIWGAGANSNSVVNGAWRPGVDKITFIPQPMDPQSGAFLPTTNYFADRYVTNGTVVQQQLARTILQPDFLFSAGDTTIVPPTGECQAARYAYGVQPQQLFARTDTGNWLNNSLPNGNTNGEGPGVIQPPIQITYQKLGQGFASLDLGQGTDPTATDETELWGSFDGTTNAPSVYPIPQSGTNRLDIWMWLQGNINKSFEWKLVGLSGTRFTMQTSTNLLNWTNLFTLTNDGGVCNYYVDNPIEAKRFYRLVPQ